MVCEMHIHAVSHHHAHTAGRTCAAKVPQLPSSALSVEMKPLLRCFDVCSQSWMCPAYIWLCSWAVLFRNLLQLPATLRGFCGALLESNANTRMFFPVVNGTSASTPKVGGIQHVMCQYPASRCGSHHASPTYSLSSTSYAFSPSALRLPSGLRLFSGEEVTNTAFSSHICHCQVPFPSGPCAPC